MFCPAIKVEMVVGERQEIALCHKFITYPIEGKNEEGHPLSFPAPLHLRLHQLDDVLVFDLSVYMDLILYSVPLLWNLKQHPLLKQQQIVK